MFRQLKIPFVFTLEASFAGASIGELAGQHFSAGDLMHVGKCVLKSIWETKQLSQDKNLLRKFNAEAALTVNDNELDSDASSDDETEPKPEAKPEPQTEEISTDPKFKVETSPTNKVSLNLKVLTKTATKTDNRQFQCVTGSCGKCQTCMFKHSLMVQQSSNYFVEENLTEHLRNALAPTDYNQEQSIRTISKISQPKPFQKAMANLTQIQFPSSFPREVPIENRILPTVTTLPPQYKPKQPKISFFKYRK